MDQRVRDRVGDWSERPVEGLDGLGALADEGFSGVVEHSAGSAWFAMLNGSILGVHGGRVEDFEGGEALARSAPSPGVALLMAMLAADAEPEERYYTEDTAVSQAHETLSSGGFAGYLELSENVLSGDYYVAYYGDHSAPVGFVGNSDRLVTGDEALDRADDEVGIYQVYAVDLDVVDLPDRVTDTGAAGATDTDVHEPSNGERTTNARTDTTEDANTRRIEPPDTGDSSPTGAGSDASRAVGTDPAADAGPGGGTRTVDPDEADARSGRDRETEYGSSTSYGTPPGGGTSDPDTDPEREFYSDLDPENDEQSGANADRSGEVTTETDSDTDTGPGPAENRTRGDEPRGVETTETRTDPAPMDTETRTDSTATEGRTETPATDTDADRPGESPADGPGTPPDAPPSNGASGSGSSATEPAGDASSGERGTPGGEARDAEDAPESAGVPADLRRRIEDHERSLEGLRERAASLEAVDERAREAHEGLRADVEDIAADLSDLRRTVMRLDRTVERLEAGGATRADTEEPTDAAPDPPDETATDAGTTDGRDMSPETALAETTLLLRYGSRGAPTLSAAHDDTGVERAAVEENLRVDVHTPFDDRAATVDGRPFGEFIENRIEYRFFEWLVRDLLFEIRETGTQNALRDLYDALPSIDRAELRTAVVVGEDDEDDRVEFDVVVRDAHERPLVVARINASRDPATEEMVVGLRDSASHVGEDADLAAAFSVTESYFSGSARDAAEEATADSILSRNSKESYVKLSRKRGYHLCLVAVGSDEEFHLRVPDL